MTKSRVKMVVVCSTAFILFAFVELGQAQRRVGRRSGANASGSNSDSGRRFERGSRRSDRLQNQGNRSPSSGRRDRQQDYSRDNYYRNAYPSNQLQGSVGNPSAYRSELATDVPNELPPKQVVRALPNADPGVASLEPINADTYSLAGEVVRDTARETVAKLLADLGPAADDPQVRAGMENLAAKMENGQVVPEQDVNTLVQAAVNSGKLQDPNGIIPIALQDRLNHSLDKLIGLSEALSILDKPFPPNGTIPGMPSGTIYVVACPPLGDGQMLVLPDGDVLCGTGGQGGFDVFTADASDLLGVQIGIGEPLPDGVLGPAETLTSGVLVLNPADNTRAVNITYDGRSYTVKPGGEEYFSAADQLVRFDRGRGRGQARYKLTEGTFVFTTTDRGWELYKPSFSVSIDNGANESVFRYVVDNAQQQVAAGQSKTHDSKYPLLVRFDRGGGSEASKDIISADSILVVAVNPRDGLWDLYASANFPQYDRGAIVARTNLSAQAALLKERDKLMNVGKRQRFNVMKPVFDEPNRSTRSWDLLRAKARSESVGPSPSQGDDIAETLPMPLGD